METQKREAKTCKMAQSTVTSFFFLLTLSFFIYARQDESGHYVMSGEVNVCLPPGTDCSEDVRCQQRPPKSGFGSGYCVMAPGTRWIRTLPAGRSPFLHPSSGCLHRPAHSCPRRTRYIILPSPVSKTKMQESSFLVLSGFVDNLSRRHQIYRARWHFPVGTVSDEEGCTPRTPVMTF